MLHFSFKAVCYYPYLLYYLVLALGYNVVKAQNFPIAALIHHLLFSLMSWCNAPWLLTIDYIGWECWGLIDRIELINIFQIKNSFQAE